MSLHVPILGDKLATLKPEGDALQTNASFHEVIRLVSIIEFRPDLRTRVGFATAQFCHYTLEPNPDATADVAPERLTIAFSTADVTILGARLAHLVVLLNKQNLEWVAAIDDRYANANERPWVGKITVGRFDKQ